jgi:hypothetical protein
MSTKNILLNLKKSLNFLDNKTYRYLVIVLLVLYSSFVSIRYNYSNLFNHWLVRLLFLIVIVYVSMKDATIGTLLAISMLISINYKPAIFTEGMQSATEEDDENVNESMENQEKETETTPDLLKKIKDAMPVASNVPENKKNNTPAPTDKNMTTSQPADVNSKNNIPVPSNNTVNTPTTQTPKSSLVDVPPPPQTNEGFFNFAGKTEYFSASGYTNDYDEDKLAPVSYTKSGNCLEVLKNTNGSSLNLSSPCGAVATFKNEMNAQGFNKLPMGKGK